MHVRRLRETCGSTFAKNSDRSIAYRHKPRTHFKLDAAQQITKTRIASRSNNSRTRGGTLGPGPQVKTHLPSFPRRRVSSPHRNTRFITAYLPLGRRKKMTNRGSRGDKFAGGALVKNPPSPGDKKHDTQNTPRDEKTRRGDKHPTPALTTTTTHPERPWW